jgi:hypothetical protein
MTDGTSKAVRACMHSLADMEWRGPRARVPLWSVSTGCALGASRNASLRGCHVAPAGPLCLAFGQAINFVTLPRTVWPDRHVETSRVVPMQNFERSQLMNRRQMDHGGLSQGSSRLRPSAR